MKYWLTTQHPKVLEYDDDEHGVWESKRGRDSGNKLRRNDKVAIYEVQRDKRGTRKDGAKAVVAIVQVDRIITPPDGPDAEGFFQIAEASLIAKDDTGLSGEKTQKILKGSKTKGNFGLLIHRIYGGRVTEIPLGQFARIENWFTNDAKKKREWKMEAEEGQEDTAERKFRKRCSGLIAQKKRNSDYRCEVCHMSFQELYGDRGKEYITVHHRHPIAMRSEPSKTTLDDLNLVCSNCHAMLHHGNLLTVRQLRRITKNM